MHQKEQQFLSELGKDICISTDKLRFTIGTSQYKYSAEYMCGTVTSPYSN